MKCENLGLDIGSRTIKLVGITSGVIAFSKKTETGFNPLCNCQALLKGLNYKRLITTGYGRHLIADHFDCQTISEIKAHALGAKFYFPNARTIIDMGGQDTKVIGLDEAGKTKKFEMNDKCAAGTGRFLEIMAMALGYTLEDFSKSWEHIENNQSINSTCAVFAESEVISLLGRGTDPSHIAKGIHISIVNRCLSMLRRVGIVDDIVFSGGVALSNGIKNELSKKLGKTIKISNDPQILGALGCAIS